MFYCLKIKTKKYLQKEFLLFLTNKNVDKNLTSKFLKSFIVSNINVSFLNLNRKFYKYGFFFSFKRTNEMVLYHSETSGFKFIQRISTFGLKL
jgi:hypothetical protein